MPPEYGLLFLVSFLAALVSTPLYRRLALWLDITDKPSSRKIHTTPIPYLGGLAFHTSTSLVLLTAMLVYPYLFSVQIDIKQLLTLYAVASGFMILGIWDDTYPVAPSVKLFVQALLAILLVGSGFSIDQMSSPFGGRFPLGWTGWILSVIWILTIVNAVNFIDGLDGLATGIVFFAALANFAIALQPWQNFICLISIILMGTTLGFLPYNFSPARIFMGDAGSLFLGVMLAGSALVSNVKGATVMSLSLPLVILCVPLLDATLTIFRRGKRGFNFFKADREHLHHRLLRLGFTDRQAVMFVYGFCFLLTIASILAARLPDQYTFLFILFFFISIFWGMTVFSAFEKRIIQSKEETSIPAENM